MKIFRSILSVAILLMVCAFAFHWRERSLRASGPLPQSAYVWQRFWTPAVRDAVCTSAPDFSTDVVLAAEVSFHSGQLNVAHVAVDYPSLKRAGIPVGIALRIGPFHGPFSENDETTSRLGDLAVSLLSDAAKAGVSPVELQIDFDCAESKLAGYRLWVEAIRKRVAPVPVTITALPAWLSQPEFAPLARTAGGYVLQVHSLNRPMSVDAPLTLCDPIAARRAVEQAGYLGVPFRVALPTYGYLVAFDESGHFQGLSAEGAALTWPQGTTVRTLRADPDAMSKLVCDWTADRPRCMTGVIWYRLPTADDSLNWRWKTLQAVMAGHSPRANLQVEIVRSEPRLFEVQLRNAGDADAPLTSQVTVHWQGESVVASDALGGFEESEEGAQMIIRPSNSVAADQLAPGEHRAIAWMRFTQDLEVQADVSPITP